MKPFVLLLLLAAPLWAESFDAAAFFGDDYTPDKNLADSGTLRVTLDTAPNWFDFSGSGPGRAQSRFAFTTNGLVISPDDEHGTCEALLDVGVARVNGGVTLSELDRGGAFAWHVRDLEDSARAWLVELKREADGSYELRIRARNGGRYVAVPGASHAIAKLDLPAEFKFGLEGGSLSGEIGGVVCSTKITLGGATLSLAVTDERARLRDLALQVVLHPVWIADAAARLAARRALERLREYATSGLLSGIAKFPHPGTEQALQAYTPEQRKQREATQDVSARAEALAAIAQAHPRLAAAQHEAGVALLLAGQPGAGQVRLSAADELLRTPVTSLALAEGCRRVGDLAAAAAALERAKKDLPAALQPDFALVEGRLLADRGDIDGARRVLTAARDKFPDRAEIEAFAASAGVLVEPPTLRASQAAGPLGLKLTSDLDEPVLGQLVERLGPYLERIRMWLPDLPEKLTGVVAIFSSPVDYLNAALLVAGENVDNVAGMYLPHGIGGEPSVMACRAFGEDELIRTLVHELWHFALAAVGRSQAVPRWLNEGMAVFLSAGAIERGSMIYASLPSEFEAFGDAPLEMFTLDHMQAALEARPAEFYVPGNVRANYLAGWALVWYYASARVDVTLLRSLLKGEAAAYRRVSEDVKSLHESVKQALEKGIK